VAEITAQDVIARIEPIMRDIFDEYSGPVDAALDARAVPQWDSLSHIELIVAVEKAFGLSFATAEIGRMGNLGDLAELVVRKARATP
jgi:acyl carrier protein